MKKFLIFLLPLVFLLTYCQKNIGGITASQIDKSLEKAITDGDSRPKIEKAMNELGLVYTYDDLFNRYDARIKDNQSNCINYFFYDCAVLIRIHLDQNNKYENHNVEVHYSGL